MDMSLTQLNFWILCTRVLSVADDDLGLLG